MSSSLQTRKKVKLFWNVQFIYELVLARKELESFNVEYKIKNDLKDIKIINIPNLQEFIKRTAYFEEIDGFPSIYSKITKANVTRSINQYLTHWIYPYKGKFHPQLIRALINIMGMKKGDTILDPFIGSGTTALESQLLGINCVGFDISEVCVRITRVKTQAVLRYTEISNEFEKIKDKLTDISNQKNIEIEINRIDELIEKIEDENTKNFLIVAELIAHSDKARRKKKNFTESFIKNAEKMLQSLKDYNQIVNENKIKLGDIEISSGDARNLNLKLNSVDGIICSPPYSIALNYVENDKHALEALGYNTDLIKEDFIGVRGSGKAKIELYNEDLIKSYSEMDRVLKPGKYCSIIIGNAKIDKKEIDTVETTINYFSKKGYLLESNIDKIIFGLYNVMQKENILIFKKPM